MLTLPLLTILVFGFYLLSSNKILKEYECGVIFRLGGLLPEAKGPGLIPFSCRSIGTPRRGE